jgi:hypothetical protein
MAWEYRSGGPVYYHSVRVAGTSRKVYLGKGPEALAQSERVAQACRQREAQRAALRAEQARVAGAEQRLHDARQLIEMLAAASVLLRGYHWHRGGWRRRRGHPPEGTINAQAKARP